MTGDELANFGALLKTIASNIEGHFECAAKVSILIRLPEHQVPHDTDILVSNDEVYMVVSSLQYLEKRGKEACEH